MLELEKKEYLIRVVDDNKMHLDAIRFALEADDWVVATYLSAEQFLNELDFSIRGCILLDIKMPILSGPQVQEELNEYNTLLPIIFLTGHGDMDTAIHAFRRGAFDFLQKPVDVQDLIKVITSALEKSDEWFRLAYEKSPQALYDSLTERQKQVLKDLKNDLDSKIIAEKLNISPRTLQRHRQNVLRKLGIHDPKEIKKFFRSISKA